MSHDTRRGYQLIDPGLGMPRSALALDLNGQAQCLMYLMRRIKQLMPIPDGIFFELIVAQYTGGPFPCIGLYTPKFVDTDENLCLLSFAISEQLEHLVNEVGIERVITLAAEEDVCWKDMLKRYEKLCQIAETAISPVRSLDIENLAASGFNPWHS